MQSRVKEAIILAVAILCLGVFFYRAQIDVKDRDRVVFVRGLAEREVSADFVIWPIVYKEVGNDLADLSATLQSKSQILEKFLLENGVQKENITYSTPAIVDADGELYSGGKHAYRYVATVVATVATNDVELVRKTMEKQGELLKHGIAFSGSDYQYRTVYSFNGLNEIKPTMIDEATRNARTAAEKFAKDSDSKLGKIKTATQGVFSIEDRDENTPYIKKLRVVTTVTYSLKN